MALPPKDYATEGSPIEVEGRIRQLVTDMEAELDRFIAETYTGEEMLVYEFSTETLGRWSKIQGFDRQAVKRMLEHRYRLAGWGQFTLIQRYNSYKTPTSIQVVLKPLDSPRKITQRLSTGQTLDGFLETIETIHQN